jgi:hypothetical protein
LVDSFELLDFLLKLSDLLSILGHSLLYSGGKPIGYGVDGGIECWVEGKDCFSQHQRDHWVLVLGEVNEAGNRPIVTGLGVLLIVSNNGEWEGGSCRRCRDLCKGVSLIG